MKSDDLTVREKQVVDGVCRFKKRAAIAADLGIAVRTVDVYLLRIRQKTRLSSMLEIAVFFSIQTERVPRRD